MEAKQIITVSGMPVSLELLPGDVRRGIASDGTGWERTMSAGYGSFAIGESADDEAMDVYCSPELILGDTDGDGDMHVINQLVPGTDCFDEHKVMAGYASADAARAAYLAHYPDGWKGLGSSTMVSPQELKLWLMSGDRTQPLTREIVEGLAGSTGDALTYGDARWNAEERRKFLAAEPESFAGPDGSFPIKTPEDVAHATRLYGHAKDPDAVKAAIISIAKRKGAAFEARLPQSWTAASGDSASESGSLWDIPAHGQRWEVLSDSSKVLRVRQLATIADAINLNNRVYPRSVLGPALDRARENARAGAMLMEMAHPEVVKTRRGRQRFVDNPDRKTARIDDISPIAPGGEVYIDYTLLPTQAGQDLAKRFRAGNPPGTSMRFDMAGRRGRVGADEVDIAEQMEVHTFDHVENPAVSETRRTYQLLTDSLREQLGIPAGAGAHASAGDNSKTSSELGTRAGGSQRRSRMETVQRGLSRGYSLLAAAASLAMVMQARKLVADEIQAAEVRGEDVVEATRQLLQFDADMRAAGYRGGTGPVMVEGNQTGSNERPGFAPDVRDEDDPAQGEKPTAAPEMDRAGNTGLTAQELTEWREERERRQAAQADEARKVAIKAACDAAKSQSAALAKLTPAEQEFILSEVETMCGDAAGVPAMVEARIDAYGKLAAAQRLTGMGYAPAAGNTVNDPANPMRVEIVRETPKHLEYTEKLLAAADDVARSVVGSPISPDSPWQQSVRRGNKPLIDRMLHEFVSGTKKHGSVAAWFAAEDALCKGGEKAFCDSVLGPAEAMMDAITTANLLNQPSILMALIIESFQDLQALRYVQLIGPGSQQPGSSTAGWMSTGGGEGPGRVGTVLRIPTEVYNFGTGYSARPTRNFNPGLATPEGTGIAPVSMSLTWQSFAPTIMRLAAEISHDVVLALGNGPLNYGAWGRILYWMGVHKSQVVDLLLMNGMVNTADEFGAVTNTNETADLPNNSVYNAAGSITVNLNPAKLADAAVVGDNFATYGPNVVGAIRFKCGGTDSAGRYCGNGLQVAGVSILAAGVLQPNIVRPRVKTDIDASGNITTTTMNPITFTTPANAGLVEGYLDDQGSVQAKPGTANPTHAFDFESGVVVFTSAFPTIAGASGVMTAPAVQFATYAYATNYDAFQVNNVTLPTGVTYEQYLNGLLRQFDQTAAFMGSPGRYVKPDLALMSLNLSTRITPDTAFFKLNSPTGTELYPDEQFFANRNGVMMARTNAPWQPGDGRIWIGRQGSTKYAVEQPFQTEGPYPKYDSSNNIVDNKIFYGREKSTVCTPQVTDANGNILNPVSRMLRTY